MKSIETLACDKTICIIGSGISGLACGSKLISLGYHNIIMLEANKIAGGRIRKLKGFASIDIELGAEEIHGISSIYNEIVDKNGGELFNYWKENKFYTEFNGEFGKLEDLLPKYKPLVDIWDLYSDIYKGSIKQYPDITLKEYLKSINASEDVYFLANALIGVESGCDLNTISIKGFCEVCKDWEAGPENYFLRNTTHIDIILTEFANVLKNIKYNCPIVDIDYSNHLSEEKIILTDSFNNNYLCDYCVVTVPVSQIQKNKIIFTPVLSLERQIAFSKINMGSSSKLILKFKECFWPSDSSAIFVKGMINYFWSTVQGKQSNDFVLTGLTSGENCRILNDLHRVSKEKFISTIITDLESTFHMKIMELLVDYHWTDWTAEPFIEGGYTFSSVNEGNARDIIRIPLENKIFFAGEAYALNGHIGTMHGALETGYAAAEAINNLNI